MSTIMLVDDDDLVREAFSIALRREGHEILTAPGGHEALAILEGHSVDLIISDQVMPAMTGDRLLAEVARRWPDVERILMTGFATMDALIKGVNDGIIGYYLPKPIEHGALTQAVRMGVARTYGRRLLREETESAALERDRALRLLGEVSKFVLGLRAPANGHA